LLNPSPLEIGVVPFSPHADHGFERNVSMSASCRLSFKLAVAGFCCLATTVALAQQGQSGAQSGSSQSGSNSANSANSGQSGRSSAAQTGRSSSQQGAAGQSGQRYTANYGGSQSSAGGQSQETDQFFANCLLADNRAEVELSQLAEKQAHNSEVKQFAQMMVRDHQKMIQQLESVAGSQAGATRGSSSTSSNENSGSNTSSASGTSSVGGLSNTSTNSQTAGQSSNSGSTTASQTANSGLPGTSGASQTTSRDATSLTSGAGANSLTTSSSGGNDAVQQIAQIDRQIVDRKSQMVKEDLQQKSGAEFDKCFMGTAVAAHTHALAALEVISQQSQGQLAQITKQAQPTVQEHLERAKQLIKQLDSESGGSSSGSTNQAERSSSRTER
jgi:predicted outer membrane protein